MPFEQEANCFEIFVFGLAVALSIWPSGASKGVSGMIIVNITVSEPVRHERSGIINDVTVKWQLFPFNKIDVPSFRVWLTRNNKKERNVSVLESQKASINSFQYTFVHIYPGKDYTAHIECFSSMENMTSYGNITFDVNRLHRDLIVANFSADDGYLMINWGVDKTLRNVSLPIVYNITLCSNDKPFLCSRTFLMCKATYRRHNGSASSGEVQLYEKNWHKYMKEYYPNYQDRQRPLRGAWDSLSYRFSCGIHLKLCSNKWLKFRKTLEYQVDFGDGRVQRQTKKIVFGLSPKPVFIKIDFNKTTDPNRVIVNVHWRVRQNCEPVDPPDRVRIIIIKSGKNIFERSFSFYSLRATDPNKTRVSSFREPLLPYSMYIIAFVTQFSWTEQEVLTTKKIFWTPEGVPSSKPIIQPIVSQNNDCVDNKRNETVKWKLPPLDERNGIIRNVTLRYYKKNSPKDANVYSLANVTETEIIGMDCYVDYLVQVRACIRGNKSCSEYSRAQVIKAKVQNDESPSSDSIVPIWATSIGVGLALIIVALLACQYMYRRRRKSPLEPLTEDPDNKYYLTDQAEKSKPGEYDSL